MKPPLPMRLPPEGIASNSCQLFYTDPADPFLLPQRFAWMEALRQVPFGKSREDQRPTGHPHAVKLRRQLFDAKRVEVGDNDASPLIPDCVHGACKQRGRQTTPRNLDGIGVDVAACDLPRPQQSRRLA